MAVKARDIPRITFGMLLIAGNTLVHVTPLFVVAVVKVLIPQVDIRRVCSRWLAAIAESWIAFNSGCIARFTDTRFHVDAPPHLRPDGSYLILSNHQSWVDIPVLQQIFNRHVPFMRFFLKSQLIWVPVLGLAWWALDFPVLKRHSKSTLAKHPDLRRQDMETTRRACRKFRGIPVSIMSFVEGTRFRSGKHARQSSPYKHLLRPKVGGIAFVLGAMGDALHEMLDVTIVYPDGPPTMLDLIGNQICDVYVYVRRYPIPEALLGGDYENDREYRLRVQEWINDIWQRKDALIARTLAAPSA